MDTDARRVVARYKSALEQPNPLDSLRKPQAVKYLYRLIGRTTDGIFSDESWRPVHAVFKLFRRNDIPYEITSAEYERTRDQPRGAMPGSKVWKIEISFLNQRGRPDTIYGTITAAGAGSVEDPLDKYDVTVVLG